MARKERGGIPDKKGMNIPREDTGYTQQDNKVLKNMIWKNNQKARQTQIQIKQH